MFTRIVSITKLILAIRSSLLIYSASCMREHIEMRIQIAPEINYFINLADYFLQAVYEDEVPYTYTEVDSVKDTLFPYKLSEFQAACRL
jgi:hypothetical protein